jgi:hypothetical protein
MPHVDVEELAFSTHEHLIGDPIDGDHLEGGIVDAQMLLKKDDLRAIGVRA